MKKISKLIKLSEVIKQAALSKSQIYKLINEGKFPKQVKLGPSSSAWVESEVEDWIQQKILERDYMVSEEQNNEF